METIKDIDLKNKTILVRTGFDVPLQKGKVVDNHRIVAGLPTIKYLLRQNCKIILIFHIGRPEGKVIRKLSVAPVQDELTTLLDLSIFKAPACTGKNIKEMVGSLEEQEILILENLRFYSGEEKNEENFARELASLAQVFVQDGFSVLHREHASTVGIPKFLPTVAGLLVAKEVGELGRAKDRPQRPAIVIIGGAKVETKIPVIDNLLKKRFDLALIGGTVANHFLALQGAGLKESLIEKDLLENCRKILERYKEKIILPSDFVWNNKGQIFDLGPKTICQYREIIRKAKTIIWNGPLGVFEEEKYAQGTGQIAEAIASSSAKKISGGGDTISALNKFRLLSKFDFVSTGGGTMLRFLAGEKLPGLEILKHET